MKQGNDIFEGNGINLHLQDLAHSTDKTPILDYVNELSRKSSSELMGLMSVDLAKQKSKDYFTPIMEELNFNIIDAKEIQLPEPYERFGILGIIERDGKKDYFLIYNEGGKKQVAFKSIKVAKSE